MIGIKNVKTVILSIQNQINTKQPQNANTTEYVHRMIMTILFLFSALFYSKKQTVMKIK